MPRFEKKEVRNQQLHRLSDILESNPLTLRYELESADGRLASRTALQGETVRIRDGAVKPGGVSVAYALHTWTLSLTQLRRLRFPVNGNHSEERNGAARTVLAALALYALAAQRRNSGYLLRSRCELIPQNELTLELLAGSVDAVPYTFDSPKDIREKLLDPAIAEARETHHFGWESMVIRLTPTPKLLELVRASDARRPEEEPEEEGEADAGAKG